MKRIGFVLLFISFSLHLIGQDEKQQLIDDVNFLASDDLSGREIGTDGEIKAAEYIAERMASLGLEPSGTEGYFQLFSVTPKANPHSTTVDTNANPIEGRNVIGYINNGAEYTVVIGAHFDHLGLGGEGSLHANGEAIHNGADDNASGIGLMLNLAQKLHEKRDRFAKNNYLFIAFSGEEKGLWGSNYYCKNPTIELEAVNYMLNFDMVGRLDEKKGLAINGVGTSSFWEGSLEEARIENLSFIISESGVGPSDHTSFYLQDIPVLHFFTGQHEDYHKPSDDVEKLNFDGILSISTLVLKIIKQGEQQTKLEFVKTKDDAKATPRFTVTLGVMPDYMYQGEGMRIDGVTDGKPASKAGFEKGDIVVQMGEHKVDGMQTYMEALSQFKKGDATKVKVKRGEEIVEAEVQF